MSLRIPRAGTPFLKVAAICSVIAPTTVLADESNSSYDYQPPQKTVQFVLGAGITTGGDKILDVDLYDEDGDSSSADLYAGAFIHIYGGLNFLIPNSDFSVQSTIGWFGDTITAENGSVSFTRIPLEVIPYYNVNNIRIGFGLTYHLNPELDGSDAAGPNADLDFDDALGTVLSIEYKFGNGFAAGLRHTSIEYELSDFDATSLDGSNIGLYGTFLF